MHQWTDSGSHARIGGTARKFRYAVLCGFVCSWDEWAYGSGNPTERMSGCLAFALLHDDARWYGRRGEAVTSSRRVGSQA